MLQPLRAVMYESGLAMRHVYFPADSIISLQYVMRREGVTQSASKLQQLGVISYKRGLITVLDRPKLEALGCECYEVVGRETELLLAYLPQRQVIRNSNSIPTVTLPTSDTVKILVAEQRTYVS